jgi:hypothetical protein
MYFVRTQTNSFVITSHLIRLLPYRIPVPTVGIMSAYYISGVVDTSMSPILNVTHYLSCFHEPMKWRNSIKIVKIIWKKSKEIIFQSLHSVIDEREDDTKVDHDVFVFIWTGFNNQTLQHSGRWRQNWQLQQVQLFVWPQLTILDFRCRTVRCVAWRHSASF